MLTCASQGQYGLQPSWILQASLAHKMCQAPAGIGKLAGCQAPWVRRYLGGNRDLALLPLRQRVCELAQQSLTLPIEAACAIGVCGVEQIDALLHHVVEDLRALTVRAMHGVTSDCLVLAVGQLHLTSCSSASMSLLYLHDTWCQRVLSSRQAPVAPVQAYPQSSWLPHDQVPNPIGDTFSGPRATFCALKPASLGEGLSLVLHSRALSVSCVAAAASRHGHQLHTSTSADFEQLRRIDLRSGTHRKSKTACGRTDVRDARRHLDELMEGLIN